MVMHMFQCYSLKSSHPLTSPTVSKSLFLMLLSPCCPANCPANHCYLSRFHIYALIYLAFWLTSLCIIGKEPLLTGQGRGWVCHPGHIQYNICQPRECVCLCCVFEWLDAHCTDSLVTFLILSAVVYVTQGSSRKQMPCKQGNREDLSRSITCSGVGRVKENQ